MFTCKYADYISRDKPITFTQVSAGPPLHSLLSETTGCQCHTQEASVQQLLPETPINPCSSLWLSPALAALRCLLLLVAVRIQHSLMPWSL